MRKPRLIEWLEEETGEEIPYTPETEVVDRHLSVRLNNDLAAGLSELAAERGVSLSQLVRELLSEVVAKRRATADLDTAALIDQLRSDVAEVQRRLAG